MIIENKIWATVLRALACYKFWVKVNLGNFKRYRCIPKVPWPILSCNQYQVTTESIYVIFVANRMCGLTNP